MRKIIFLSALAALSSTAMAQERQPPYSAKTAPGDHWAPPPSYAPQGAKGHAGGCYGCSFNSDSYGGGPRRPIPRAPHGVEINGQW